MLHLHNLRSLFSISHKHAAGKAYRFNPPDLLQVKILGVHRRPRRRPSPRRVVLVMSPW
ncbi:hypothetical protein HanIR_Chr06g0287511 [Helianthus annuus]|nr:hypothetical protein HanIR_Chr06g0287511 [Helianthus annuus]